KCYCRAINFAKKQHHRNYLRTRRCRPKHNLRDPIGKRYPMGDQTGEWVDRTPWQSVAGAAGSAHFYQVQVKETEGPRKFTAFNRITKSYVRKSSEKRSFHRYGGKKRRSKLRFDGSLFRGRRKD